MTSMTLNGADREAERPPTSLRVLCFVASLLLFLVAPVWLGTAYYVNVHAVPKQSNPVTPVVEVHDETGSFRDIGGRPLNAVLEDVRFSRAVRLVVLSTDSLSGGDMDQAVVTYARANHPEWLSAGGSTWANGYVILVVSPADHMVGTYVGDDVVLPLAAQKDVQDAAKDDFRNGRWSEGIVAAVNKAAALIPGENTQRQGNIVPWPPLYAWTTTAAGIVVCLIGGKARRRPNEVAKPLAEQWNAMEKRHIGVESSFAALLAEGGYERGLTARYQAARAEREKVRARITSARGKQATMRSLTQAFQDLSDADTAMEAACEFFALSPNWRSVWANEVGPVFEDLDVVDLVARTAADRTNYQHVITLYATLSAWTNEQRVAVKNLQGSIERAEVTPAKALECLDWIANEARLRLAVFVENVLAADTSWMGRRRYSRWQAGKGEKLKDYDLRYIGTYSVDGWSHSYNPAVTIRLTAHCAGIDLSGSAAIPSGRFMAYNAPVYVPPAYFNRYIVYDGITRYSASYETYLTSPANLGTANDYRNRSRVSLSSSHSHGTSSSGGFHGSGSSSSF